MYSYICIMRRKPVYTSPRKLPPQRPVLCMNPDTLEVEYVNELVFTERLYKAVYTGNSSYPYNTGMFHEMYHNFPTRMIWVGNNDKCIAFYDRHGFYKRIATKEKYYGFKNFDRFHEPTEVALLHHVSMDRTIPTPFDISRAGLEFAINILTIHPFAPYFRAAKIDSLLC